MNGSEAAQLVEFARRSHEAAERSAAHALHVDQSVSLIQREVSDIRREMRRGFEALSAGLADRPRQRHASITEEDWEDSPTGTHKMVSKRTFETWARDRELSADAKRWRRVLRLSLKAGGFILAIVVGWLIRHYLGHP